MRTFHVFHHIVIFLPHCPFRGVVLNYFLFLFFTCFSLREAHENTQLWHWRRCKACHCSHLDICTANISLPLWSGSILVQRCPPVLILHHSLHRTEMTDLSVALYTQWAKCSAGPDVYCKNRAHESDQLLETTVNGKRTKMHVMWMYIIYLPDCTQPILGIYIFNLLQGFLQFWCKPKPAERPHTSSLFLVVKTKLTYIHLIWNVKEHCLNNNYIAGNKKIGLCKSNKKINQICFLKQIKSHLLFMFNLSWPGVLYSLVILSSLSICRWSSLSLASNRTTHIIWSKRTLISATALQIAWASKTKQSSLMEKIIQGYKSNMMSVKTWLVYTWF